MAKNYNKWYCKLCKVDLNWSEKYTGTPGQLADILEDRHFHQWSHMHYETNNCCSIAVQ